jgi:uncharacterized membrane protein required for colicin V production
VLTLPVLFWVFVVLFAVVGTMRGWAKEILVTFSVILALFILTVLETYVPFVRNLLARSSPSTMMYLQIIIVLVLAFFGYQTPNIRGLAGPRFARERFQDALLGFILGALNGYLIFGSIWFFINEAGYPNPSIVTAPQAGTALAQQTVNYMKWMPPAFLVPPWIYLAVGVAFLFVIVVFL